MREIRWLISHVQPSFQSLSVLVSALHFIRTICLTSYHIISSTNFLKDNIFVGDRSSRFISARTTVNHVASDH